MKDLSRRFFVRALGALPGAAVAVELQAKAAAHGVALLPPDGLNPGIAAPAGTNTPAKFFEFAEWWKAFGKESAEQRARHVSHFDADILAMQSISLPTKIRMQRARNFERIMAEQKQDFFRRVARDGHFQWWA